IDAMFGVGCAGLIAMSILLIVAAIFGYAMIAWIVSGVLLAFLLGSLLLERLPIVKQVDQAAGELQLEYPPVVLVLRRVPEGTDTSQVHGLAFGAGNIRRQRAKGFEVVFPGDERASHTAPHQNHPDRKEPK